MLALSYPTPPRAQRSEVLNPKHCIGLLGKNMTHNNKENKPIPFVGTPILSLSLTELPSLPGCSIALYVEIVERLRDTLKH